MLLLERIGSVLDRLVDYVQGASLPRIAWCNPGLPVVLLAPLLATMPFTTTAPVRAIAGWSLVASLPLAVLLSAAILAPVAAAWRARAPLRHPVAAHSFPLLVALFSILVLYRRDFAGLTNFAGADGGVHIYQHKLFVGSHPGIYLGFVSMYGLMYWIEQITRCNVFWALCVVYYFGVAFVAAVPCLITLVVLEPFADRRGWWIGLAAGAAAALTLSYFVVLPQQHYHQTDGFFAHLFALVPLMVAWLVDATVRARLWRWLGLLISVAFYRFTYGLNLADFLVTVGALLFLDSFGAGLPLGLRWLLRVVPLPATWAALSFLRQLEPQTASYGWIIAYDLPTVLWAQLCAVAGMGGFMIVAALLPARQRSALRALRLPVAFTLVSAAVAYYGLRLPVGQPYYLLKYPVHAVVLASSALVVVAAASTAQLGEAVRARRWLVLALSAMVTAVCVGAFNRWRLGFALYQPTFQERVFGHAPYQVTHPLADLGATNRIERVLRSQNKKFGGYITSYWPMFNFMNATFDYFNGGRVFWEHGGVRLERGYCVFWDHGKVDWWSQPSDLTAPLRVTLKDLEARQDRACVSYRAHWNHAVERTLCHVCD
ncbi:MAG: uncharacterized protein JWM53_2364 [bacterium]|nr:uncharacterized protein [bacterium]